MRDNSLFFVLLFFLVFSSVLFLVLLFLSFGLLLVNVASNVGHWFVSVVQALYDVVTFWS